MRATARTKQTVKVVGIAVAVLLLAEMGVRGLEHRLPPPQDWFTSEYGVKERQMRRLARDHGGAGVVILGSSVIDVALDPEGLGRRGGRPAYNAGLLGPSPEVVDLWSKLVVERTLRPDLVVIGISSRDVNANGFLDLQLQPFLDLPAMRRLLGRESVVEQVERKAGEVSALVRYRAALRRPLESVFGYDGPDRTIPRNTDLGFELHLTDRDYQGGPDAEAFIRSEPLRDFAVSPAQIAALQAMIERLQAQAIQVVVLDTPVTQQYVDLHPRGLSDYLDYESALRSLAAETGAALVDAGIWPPRYFADPMHVRGEGADALTRLLATYLEAGVPELPPDALAGGLVDEGGAS